MLNKVFRNFNYLEQALESYHLAAQYDKGLHVYQCVIKALRKVREGDRGRKSTIQIYNVALIGKNLRAVL